MQIQADYEVSLLKELRRKFHNLPKILSPKSKRKNTFRSLQATAIK